MALQPPGRKSGWLGPPSDVFDVASSRGQVAQPEVALVPTVADLVDTAATNPFIRYRKLLWSYHEARGKGISDLDFVVLVNQMNEAVAEADQARQTQTHQVQIHQVITATSSASSTPASSAPVHSALASSTPASSAAASSATLHTGFTVTPSASHPQLANALGLEQLLIKDETRQVAGSHKARHLFGIALHLSVNQVPVSEPLAIASCGNAALGAAVVAKGIGRPLKVFVPTDADPDILEELDNLGAQVKQCERRKGESGDPSFLRFQEAVDEGMVPFSVQGNVNILAIDSGRCMGWELAEDFADTAPAGNTSLFVQVGGGALASSIIQGLAEARSCGVISTLPRFFAVQTQGCAPLARALKLIQQKAQQATQLQAALTHAEENPSDYMWAWEEKPSSVATGIIDDITYDWLPIVWGILESGGDAPVVSDETVLSALKLAQEHTSIPAGPTGVSGLAGLCHVLDQNNVATDTIPDVFTDVVPTPDPNLASACVLLTGST